MYRIFQKKVNFPHSQHKTGWNIGYNSTTKLLNNISTMQNKSKSDIIFSFRRQREKKNTYKLHKFGTNIDNNKCLPQKSLIEKNSIFIVVVRLSRIQYKKKNISIFFFFLFSHRNPRLDTNKSFDSTRHFSFFVVELNVKVFYISVHIIRRHIHTIQHSTVQHSPYTD